MTQAQAQFFGLCALFAFGLFYDLLVDSVRRQDGRSSFLAIFVILGTVVTLFVWYLDSPGLHSAEVSLMLVLAHFAASGFGMTLGSWRRR